MTTEIIPGDLLERYFQDQDEEDAKYNLECGESNPNLIRQIRVRFSRERDFRIEFETCTGKFAFVVLLNNRNRIGWRECQAIYDCIYFASRGNEVTQDSFLAYCMHLDFRYGHVRGPVRRDNNRYVTWLHPSPGDLTYRIENMTSHMSLHFDEGTIVLRAFTFENTFYEFTVAIESSRQSLFEKDCEAFMDLLSYLEPGETMDKETFYRISARLRKNYNFILLQNVQNSGIMACHVLASRVVNTSPIEPNLARYVTNSLSSIVEPTPDSDPEDNPNPITDIVTANLPRSPYRGVTFLELIASSSQAEVFSGLLDNGTEVAVKVFQGNQQEALDSCRRELRTLRNMALHENVVQVISYMETPQPALITKLITGAGSLKDYLQANGQFDEQEGQELAIQIAKGIEHMHQSGVIHKDLKSPNIMLQRVEEEDGDKLIPVIIDFGISTTTGKDSSGTDSFQELATTYLNTTGIQGTVPWMAPEIITENGSSEKSDVYAFGIVLWEIFSGRVPFDSILDSISQPVQLMCKIHSGERPDFTYIEHLSDGLQKLIGEMLDADPAKRPTMLEVSDILSGNDIKGIFESIDNDESGKLGLSEFARFMERIQPDLKPKVVFEVFEAIDDDNNGTISFEEFRAFWREVKIDGIETTIALYRMLQDSSNY